MASTSDSTLDVCSWLKTLPLAPEYHPTLAEFQDPISYIFKIEKEASEYGICKIIPPVLPAPKKTAVGNLNRSLAARAGAMECSKLKYVPTFTTRQQQIGFCPRKQPPVRRPVWQSGEEYTFQRFEAKAKSFEKQYLKKYSKKGGLSHLDIETLFWKASVDKPFSVEYANDMPGSAFAPVSDTKAREGGDEVYVGDTAWNMRGLSRAKGSLLSFMKEEIPGVTSPMLYVAMMFSWFAWHVEDHDLHSMNYMHMGAGKTWYGVPREAAVAFEEVVRVHGYGGEINPLVTFSILGEKTTVMSPEVFISAGIPCCRLVQNAGEFVVTFPRAYHSGFSHGFNCGEASNIATPEWLRLAKDAAIRRASINYPPMVSHFQLLYDLALAFCSRIPTRITAEPQSSRLQVEKKGDGEGFVKELFVKNIIQNNDHLHILGEGSSVVVLPQSSSDISVYSNLRVGCQLRAKPPLSFSLCSQKEAMENTNLISYDNFIDGRTRIKQEKGFNSVKQTFSTLHGRKKLPSLVENCDKYTLTSQTLNGSSATEARVPSDGLSDQRLFSCVTCGILPFSCVAIVQPKESAARYLMSADCSFSDWITGSGITSDEFNVDCKDVSTSANKSVTGLKVRSAPDGLYNVIVQSVDHQLRRENQNNGVVSNSESRRDSSALGLLALNYGNLSGSEEEQVESDSGEPKLGKTIVPAGNMDMSIVSRPDEDCNRMHVFCLEHAIEVEQKLRHIGGVHMFLLCHPDYPKVEAEAKLVAKELGIDYLWYDISFRDTTEDDEKRIQEALDSEEVTSGNGDWAVKLGINLFYSANLSRSPLYSKQMSYNTVIYNAFGRSSPANSLTPPIFYGRKFGKQKKIVAGKWCGKVWMSNQVHPLLPQKHPEEQDQDRSIDAFSMKDEKLDRDLENNHKQNPVAKKSSRKRKRMADCWPTKRVKGNDVELAVSDASLEKKIQQQNRGNLRSKQSYPIEVEVSHNSLEDNSNWRPRTFRDTQPKFTERGHGVSDYSLVDNSYHQYKRTLKGKQFLSIEREYEDPYDSEDSFHQMAAETLKGKEAKYFDREDAVSDDFLEDNNCHQQRWSARGKQIKFMEKENSVSDDSRKDISYQNLRWTRRGNKAKCIEREDGLSDVYSEDNSQWRHRSHVGKQPGGLELEDAVSDNSLVNDPHEQYRQSHSCKKAKFCEREDEVSDDFGEDTLHWQQRNLRGKHGEFIEQEYQVSGNSLEDSQKDRKAPPRGKESRYFEKDVTLNNYLQQYRKNFRGKKIKQETPRLGKQKTTLLAKPLTPRQMKKKTPSSICSTKLEQNARQLNITVEEEQRGGPSTRLRKRPSKLREELLEVKVKGKLEGKIKKKLKKASAFHNRGEERDGDYKYRCDIEGCTMSFALKQEFALHKKNVCPVKGCGKKFLSHKYLVQHRKVHMDARPLKCPWKGCKMTFKWAWARTEHIRVHTGARPYSCAEPGCGQTFRFVSDFSRHKRKTGHVAK